MNTYSYKDVTMIDKACLCKTIDPHQMEKLVANAPSETEAQRLSDFFKVFGDPTRLKIIYYLSRHELCVADLSSLVGMQQSAVSHQLKVLRMSRLVKTRKDGVTIYYSLDDHHVFTLYELAQQHLKEQS